MTATRLTHGPPFQVYVEDLADGTSHLMTTARMVFISLDEQGHPLPIPPLQPVGQAEEARFQEAQTRYARRKAERAARRA